MIQNIFLNSIFNSINIHWDMQSLFGIGSIFKLFLRHSINMVTFPIYSDATSVIFLFYFAMVLIPNWK